MWSVSEFCNLTLLAHVIFIKTNFNYYWILQFYHKWNQRIKEQSLNKHHTSNFQRVGIDNFKEI